MTTPSQAARYDRRWTGRHHTKVPLGKQITSLAQPGKGVKSNGCGAGCTVLVDCKSPDHSRGVYCSYRYDVCILAPIYLPTPVSPPPSTHTHTRTHPPPHTHTLAQSKQETQASPIHHTQKKRAVDDDQNGMHGQVMSARTLSPLFAYFNTSYF